MTKKEAAEAVKPAEKNEVITETVETQNIEEVEVPAEAEEISQDEALKLAADEVNKLREENTTLKQAIDDKTNEFKALVEKNNEEAGIAAKQILELEAKVKELEAKLAENVKGGNNQFFVDLLNEFEAKIDEYAGLRRERLRKEFVTDLKEVIQKQKEQLTNA